MRLKPLLPLLLLCIGTSAFGQEFEYVYRNPADSTCNSYLKIFPTDTVKGLIIRDYSTLPDASRPSPYRFTGLSAEAGMLTLITNTSPQFPELFTHDSTLQLLDAMVHEVIRAHAIPAENIFIGGISASGTRALRYAQYCAAGKSDIRIRGVFAVDSLLDLERFYLSASRHQHNFKAGMLEEAALILPLFDRLFGGSPKAQGAAYQNASVFSHTDSLGGNAHLLKDTDVLLFHEPDIDWWMQERGCSYADINSYDLAAFAVLLKQLGNPHLEVITTTGKGFDRQGSINPHSWTIVDEDYLISWILKRTNK
ncbi:MAG: hypothetical protein AAGB22_05970 [Bacteroidota bacterium]